MQIEGQAVRVAIYIGESDQSQGKPLYMAILELLRREGASGATVTRGLAGFGAHSRIHTASIVTLSTDLPVIVVWVDSQARVERLLPQVRGLVDGGLITVETVDVLQYAPGRRPAPLDAPVQDVMRTEVVSVHPTTPVSEVVRLLLARGMRSLPVVTGDNRLLGIITDGDLLRRADLAARLGLQTELSAAQIQSQIAGLEQSGLTAAEIMTPAPVSLHTDDTVRTAAKLMAERGLKRLPVVDDEDHLTGWLSRVDLFRTLDYHFAANHTHITPPRTGASVAALMTSHVATIGPNARLEEIVQALERTRTLRAVVVDDHRRVLGIITDGDLLRRSRQRDNPTLLRRLRTLLGAPSARASVLPAGDERAVDLMTTPVISVRPETPLPRALHLMLQHNIKRLPVVDESGHFLGLLGRASVLRGLLDAPLAAADDNSTPA